MIESLQVEFGFEAPIESSELRSMLAELRQRADHAADDKLTTVLYIGAGSEYLPEQLPPSQAVDYVLEHAQGAIQFQYNGFHYLIHVNPSESPDTVVRSSSTDRLVISVDGTYFKSNAAIDAADIADIVRIIEAHTAPDVVVGFGIDSGQGDPTPRIKWFKRDANGSIPIHWVTFVPTGVTGVTVPGDIHERYELDTGTLYFLADSPTSFKDIKRHQQIMSTSSTE